MFEDPITDFLIVGGIVLFLLIIVFPGFTNIRSSEVGVSTRKLFGKRLPQGKIIATEGEIGVQSDTLMPGLYWRFWPLCSITAVDQTVIPTGKIGTITSVDGKPIPSGRILGNKVECNSFQDATAFLKNGGFRGQQVEILPPGNYRINTRVFTIKIQEVVDIPEENVGVVTAQDGIPLPSTLMVAPAPTGDHNHFTNGQAFIDNNGYRGPQLETLQPGQYYINPFLFSVSMKDVQVVPPGYVAVIISSVGKEAEPDQSKAPATNTDGKLDQPLTSAAETALITDRTLRGILRDPIFPGKYNLNWIAYKAELVPTSAVTIKWATEESSEETDVRGIASRQATSEATEFYKYSQLLATSRDGFQLGVDVKLIIRISPEKAPFVISRFGTVNNLIEQVVHPLIDSLFRNEAGNKQAMEFMHSRTELQEAALAKAREEFSKYHIEVPGLLIAYIKLDEALLATQTKRELAVQQQEQYKQEAAAQDSRIAVEEKKARADQQGKVIEANLSIEIAKDKATAAVNEANGIRDATIQKAIGEASQIKAVGEAQAQAYNAQVEVLGKDKIAAIKFMETIGMNNVVITPKINVSGGGDSNGQQGGANAMVTALLAMFLDKNTEDKDGKDKPSK